MKLNEDRLIETTKTYAQAITDLKKTVENLCWMAQTFHQNYHTDHPGSWKECSKGVCGSMPQMLGEVGLDVNLEPAERRP